LYFGKPTLVIEFPPNIIGILLTDTTEFRLASCSLEESSRQANLQNLEQWRFQTDCGPLTTPYPLADPLSLQPFRLGLAAWLLGAQNGPSAFSKPAAQPNQVFAHWSSTKRPLVSSGSRPSAAAGFSAPNRPPIFVAAPNRPLD
jgi:hypothetical protein